MCGESGRTWSLCVAAFFLAAAASMASEALGPAAAPDVPTVRGIVTTHLGTPIAGARVRAFVRPREVEPWDSLEHGPFEPLGERWNVPWNVRLPSAKLWSTDTDLAHETTSLVVGSGARVVSLPHRRTPCMVAEATTDEGGEFELAGAELGGDLQEYRDAIVVTAAGFKPESKVLRMPRETRVRFALGRGPTSSGKIVAEDGMPVAGARVEAQKLSVFQGVLDTATTAPDGTFGFATLGEGSCLLRVAAPRYQLYEDYLVSAKDESRFATITLRRGLVVRGTVVDTGGAAVAGAVVRAQGSALGFAFEVPSGTHGEFELDLLAPQTYTLSARHPILACVGRAKVEPPADGVRITLGAGATLTGWVMNARREGVAGAHVVVIEDSDVERRTLTDRHGRFRLTGIRPRPEAEKRVWAGCEGYQTMGSFMVVFEDERERTLDFVLHKPARLQGVVVDPSGAPLGEARVELFSSRGGARYLERTDAQGRFELRDLRPRPELQLRAVHPSYLTWQSEPFELGDGEEHEGFRIVMDPGPAAARGIVVDAKGAPLAGVRVTAVLAGAGRESSPEPPFADTDAEGRFEVGNLAAARYQLVACKEGYLEARTAPFASDGERAAPESRLVLVRAGSVTGRVRGQDGTPRAGIEVKAIESSSGTRCLKALTDAEGAFRIDGLGAEPVEVEVRAAAGREPVVVTGVRAAEGGVTDMGVIVLADTNQGGEK